MDRFVAILVPHAWWDGLGRGMLAMTVIASWAFFSHYVVFDQHYPTKFHYLAHILFVASPPLVLIFRLFRYLRLLQEQLEVIAATDVLTGLSNRRAFFERAEHETTSRGGVMLMIDVDNFKRINDTYGHEVGDRCLKELADLLRFETRPGDIVGRIGGEEFAVYLVDASPEEARAIGDRFAEGVRFRASKHDVELGVTTSVGAAIWCGRNDIDALLRKADAMMYEAKRAGRARLVFWDGSAAVDGKGHPPAIPAA